MINKKTTLKDDIANLSRKISELEYNLEKLVLEKAKYKLGENVMYDPVSTLCRHPYLSTQNVRGFVTKVKTHGGYVQYDIIRTGDSYQGMVTYDVAEDDMKKIEKVVPIIPAANEEDSLIRGRNKEDSLNIQSDCGHSCNWWITLSAVLVGLIIILLLCWRP